MQREVAVAIEYLCYSAELSEVVVDALQLYHGLMVGEHCQRLVLKAERKYVDLRHRLQLQKLRIVLTHRLAFRRLYFYLWVEIGEERRYKVCEAVEAAEYDDQSGRRYGHAYDRDDAYNVYGVRAFL